MSVENKTLSRHEMVDLNCSYYNNKKWDPEGKNILLLSLSTLNGDNSNTYYVKNGSDDFYFEAVSQLEPGTEYVLTKLSMVGKKVDKIIIIVTPETKQIKQKDNGEKIPSALGRYMYGISEYIKAVDSIRLLYDNVATYEKTEEYKETAYPLGNCNVILVNESDEDVLSTISNNLLDMPNEGHNVNLFIDVQGGRRTFFYTMFSTATLLRDKNVNIVESFAIDYNRNNVKHPLIDCTKEYAVLDLVSGIRTFTAYGKAKELDVFLENRDRQYTERDGEKIRSEEAELISVLKKIDQCLSINDPTGIINWLNALKKHPLIKGEIVSVDPQFRLIIDDIKRTYGSLLEGENEVSNVELILWLANKDFITQALTFVEDKLPGSFVSGKEKTLCDEEKSIWMVEVLDESIDWSKKSISEAIKVAIGVKGQDYYKPENNLMNTYFINMRKQLIWECISKRLVEDIYEKIDKQIEIKKPLINIFEKKITNFIYKNNKEILWANLKFKDIKDFSCKIGEKTYGLKEKNIPKKYSDCNSKVLSEVEDFSSGEIMTCIKNMVINEEEKTDAANQFVNFIVNKALEKGVKFIVDKESEIKEPLLEYWTQKIKRYYCNKDNKYSLKCLVELSRLIDDEKKGCAIEQLGSDKKFSEIDAMNLMSFFLEKLYGYNVTTFLQKQLDDNYRLYEEILDYKKVDTVDNAFSSLVKSAKEINGNIGGIDTDRLIRYAKNFVAYKKSVELANGDNTLQIKNLIIDNEEMYMEIEGIRECMKHHFFCKDNRCRKSFVALMPNESIVASDNVFLVEMNKKIILEGTDNLDIIEAMLSLYDALKKERNTTNHASEEVHMDYECLKAGILVVAELYKRIVM